MTSQLLLLPIQLRQPFESVFDHVRHITYSWQTYKQIFGGSKQRCDLFRSSAEDFFDIAHDALLDSVMLGMARLHDKAKTGGQSNLSFQYIENLVPCPEHAQLKQKLEEDRCALRDSCSVLTKYRHKRIAHNDHQFGLYARRGSLPDFTIEEVDSWLGLHQNWVDSVIREFEPDYEFCWGFGRFHGADRIIYALKQASAFQDLESNDPMEAQKLLRENRWAGA